MAWPQHIDHESTPESHDRFLRHLVSRETGIGLAVITGVLVIAIVLAVLLFPNLMGYAAFFFFAYIILFTLPMWVGLFEDDIEEELRRHDGDHAP